MKNYNKNLKQLIENKILNKRNGTVKGNLIRSNKLFEKIINATNFFDENTTISERIYCIMNNLNKKPICKKDFCNNLVKFYSYRKGYLLYCSYDCAYKSKYRKEKLKKLNLGKKCSIETKKKMSNTLKEKYKKEGFHWKGKHHKKESKIKMSNTRKGKKFSKKWCENIRKGLIKRTLNFNGKLFPNFNIDSIQHLNWINEQFNLNGQHGCKDGEYCIKKLGYFLDFIDFKNRIIIEWDEEKHYTIDGNLKEKDIQRQKEIENYFPDFKFIRIREKNFILSSNKEKINYIKRCMK